MKASLFDASDTVFEPLSGTFAVEQVLIYAPPRLPWWKRLGYWLVRRRPDDVLIAALRPGGVTTLRWKRRGIFRLY